MKRLPKFVKRYQESVILELYRMLKRHDAVINTVWDKGTCYAVFMVADEKETLPLDSGNTNITAMLGDLIKQVKPGQKRIKRFMHAFKTFCDDYDVSFNAPGVIYIGRHKVLTEFKLASYDIYLAWQHFEVPEEEDEDYD